MTGRISQCHGEIVSINYKYENLVSITTLKWAYLFFVGVIELGHRCLGNGDMFLSSFSFIKDANFVNIPEF